MKNKYTVLVSICTLISILCLIGVYVMLNQRVFTIELIASDSGKVEKASLNKQDLTELKKILTKQQKDVSGESLNLFLEKQREIFMQVIGLLTILLAFAGIFTFFQRLIEKSDQIELKKAIEDYDKEIIKIKFDRIILDFERNINVYKGEARIRDNEGNFVSNLKEFLYCQKLDINEMFKQAESINSVDQLMTYSSLFYSFIVYSLRRANKLGYFTVIENKNEFDAENNPILKNILENIQIKIGKSKYGNFVEELKENIRLLKPDATINLE